MKRQPGSPGDALELRRERFAVRRAIFVQCLNQVVSGLFLFLIVALVDPELEQGDQFGARVVRGSRSIRRASPERREGAGRSLARYTPEGGNPKKRTL
jgi:hypothetical protein